MKRLLRDPRVLKSLVDPSKSEAAKIRALAQSQAGTATERILDEAIEAHKKAIDDREAEEAKVPPQMRVKVLASSSLNKWLADALQGAKSVQVQHATIYTIPVPMQVTSDLFLVVHFDLWAGVSADEQLAKNHKVSVEVACQVMTDD